MDIIHDPTVQFIVNVIVALLVGITAVITSVAIFRLQHNRKEVTYGIISDTAILSINKEIRGKVEIRFAGKVVSDMRLTILKIWNSGNVPIVPSDYIEPLSFVFKGGEILDSEILEVDPSNVQASLIRNTDNVVLEPLLLNNGDTVKIKVLVAGTNSKVDVYARIIGIKKLIELDINKRPFFSGRSITSILSILVILSIVLTTIFYIQTSTAIQTSVINTTNLLSDATNASNTTIKYANLVLSASYDQAYNILSSNEQRKISRAQFPKNQNYTLSSGCWNIVGTSTPTLEKDHKTWETGLILNYTTQGSTEITTYFWHFQLQIEQGQFIIISIGLIQTGISNSGGALGQCTTKTSIPISK